MDVSAPDESVPLFGDESVPPFGEESVPPFESDEVRAVGAGEAVGVGEGVAGAEVALLQPARSTTKPLTTTRQLLCNVMPAPTPQRGQRCATVMSCRCLRARPWHGGRRPRIGRGPARSPRRP